MFTKTFSAPTGSGVRKLAVAPAAMESIKGTDRRITVIAPHQELHAQWAAWLPTATFITPIKWLRRAADADTDLIIADEMFNTQMARIMSTLSAIKTEVWLVNPNAPLAAVHAAAKLIGTSARSAVSVLVNCRSSQPRPHGPPSKSATTFTRSCWASRVAVSGEQTSGPPPQLVALPRQAAAPSCPSPPKTWTTYWHRTHLPACCAPTTSASPRPLSTAAPLAG